MFNLVQLLQKHSAISGENVNQKKFSTTPALGVTPVSTVPSMKPVVSDVVNTPTEVKLPSTAPSTQLSSVSPIKNQANTPSQGRDEPKAQPARLRGNLAKMAEAIDCCTTNDFVSADHVAIMCDHCYSGERSLGAIKRASSMFPGDSGWQFMCGESDHGHENKVVVKIAEALEKHSFLENFVQREEGSCFVSDRIKKEASLKLASETGVSYRRNTGVTDANGEVYANPEDVVKLAALGYHISPEEYSDLPEGEAREDISTYLSKVSGVNKDVLDCIDKKKPFSAEFLKDMDYSVPKGYEVKGDLVVPSEKEEKESPQKTASEKPGLWANIRAKRARGEKPAKPGDKDYPDKEQWDKLSKAAAADHPLKSSNIKAVGYDKKNETLDVKFHSGGEYTYKDVPKSLFDRIKRVKSPGKFFHKHIKKDTPFEFERTDLKKKNYLGKIRDSMDKTAQAQLPGVHNLGEEKYYSNKISPYDAIGSILFGAEYLPLPVNGESPMDSRERVRRAMGGAQAGTAAMIANPVMTLMGHDPYSAGVHLEELRERNKFSNQFKQGEDKSDILKKKDSLLPHQERIIEKLKQPDQPGLILLHGLGSGKTRSSIEAYKALGLPAEAIVPAALKENYAKEIRKWLGKHPKDLHIRSQQEVARKGIDPEDLREKLLIIDEAHRARNTQSKLFQNLKNNPASKRILLSGTPIYNHPSDVAKLVNIAAGKKLLPEGEKEFGEKYIGKRNIYPSFLHRIVGKASGQELYVKEKEQLRKVFKKMIDYHAGNSEGFPEVSYQNVGVPMHPTQEQIHQAMMQELPRHLQAKVRQNLPPEKKDLERLLHFLTGARMLSNSTREFSNDPAQAASPKIERAFKYLKSQLDKDPSYKGLVYSNYLGSGIAPYKELLEKHQIPYGEFTGELDDKLRNELVKKYNENKLKALLVSSAGAEGLDLKGTRLVQILEPHFNNEKIKQVIGRAARYKSHEALDPAQRNVLVQRYLAQVSPNFFERLRKKRPTSTDEYLQNLADEKERLNSQFIKLMQ